ncbi:MAG: cytochrome c maturation protein CcmE [Actinomycetota bacterium]|nr:cytochrome c maturation protein CcmE [Actinomycetota bacterium]
MLDESRIGDLLDGGPKPSVPRRKKRLRVWLPILVIAAALGFLIAKGLGNSLVYFRTVDEALAMKATLGTSTFRLEGVVKPHTVTTNASGGVDFEVIGQDGRTIAVHDTANPPELFQPNLPVVLVGHFQGSYFLSDQIMVKHSANYIAAHPNRVATVNGKKL